MTKLTAEQLREIRERVEKAAPAPWEVRTRSDGSRGITGPYHYPAGQHPWVGGYLHVCNLVSGDEHYGDANGSFITHARTDVPALLSHIVALEAERDKLLAVVEWTMTKRYALEGSRDEAIAEIALTQALRNLGYEVKP